jgi:hypothetical protein
MQCRANRLEKKFFVPELSVLDDVVIVNSVMWAEGWERVERGKSRRVG